MTPLDASSTPESAAVVEAYRRLMNWLLDDALPLWEAHGVDRRSGGYFETLQKAGSQGPALAAGDLRRGRVVARQIYVFDTGRRLGWRSKFADPAEHGCRYLFSHLHLGDGELHTAIDAASRMPCAPFDLYEQAFYLFALARAHPALGDRYPTAATAGRCLQRLRERYGRSAGGFEEAQPPTLPLRSNPHMHLLEAALAWIEVADAADRERWTVLAGELVDLCQAHFRASPPGAVREYFDAQWLPATGEAGRIVEPGHQFEWAWLLCEWARSLPPESSARRRCRDAARALVALAERWGVDSGRGVAVNEIWDDMKLKDADAKLWPQTERVKAWCAMLEGADTPAHLAEAHGGLAAALSGMIRYLRADAPGLWHEVNTMADEFRSGPSKASSFYHLVCAIEVLDRTLRGRSGGQGLMSGHEGVP